MAKKEAAAPTTEVATQDQYPSYYVEKADRRTGELKWVPRFRYLEGMPKEYRFDGRVGTFGLVSGGDSTKEFRLNPIAWRFFEDAILGQDDRKAWAELFFLDKEDSLSSILFHTHSLRNLEEVVNPLFYQDLTLEDITLICSSEKKEATKFNPETKKDEKFTYYLATFKFEEAPIAEVDERAAYSETIKIYRRQTASAKAVISANFRYFDMYAEYPAAEEEETQEAEVVNDEDDDLPI